MAGDPMRLSASETEGVGSGLGRQSDGSGVERWRGRLRPRTVPTSRRRWQALISLSRLTPSKGSATPVQRWPAMPPMTMRILMAPRARNEGPRRHQENALDDA